MWRQLAEALSARISGDGRGSSEVKAHIALSGGLDSSVLLHVLSHARDMGMVLPELHAIHIDHGLRSEGEALNDLRCVLSLCVRCRVPLSVYRAPPGIISRVAAEAGGVESAARRMRYRVLEDLAGENDYLLTAHHRDDRSETILMNLLQGSIRGAAGSLPAGRGRVLRPFLLMDRPPGRKLLEDYARNHGIGFSEDRSNADLRYERNFLRQEIIPRLSARLPGFHSRMEQLRQELDSLLIPEVRGSGGREPCWQPLPYLPTGYWKLDYSESSAAGVSGALPEFPHFEADLRSALGRTGVIEEGTRISRAWLKSAYRFCVDECKSGSGGGSRQLEGYGCRMVSEPGYGGGGRGDSVRNIYLIPSLALEQEKGYFVPLYTGRAVRIEVVPGLALEVRSGTCGGNHADVTVRDIRYSDVDKKSLKPSEKKSYFSIREYLRILEKPVWLAEHLPLVLVKGLAAGVIVPDQGGGTWTYMHVWPEVEGPDAGLEIFMVS